MLTVEEALDRVMRVIPQAMTERVGLGSAVGRVLAEDVASPDELPPWTASAMDGFAVRAADVPAELTVNETEIGRAHV